MRAAAIDIGTNSVLLLVAEIEEGRLDVIHEEQRLPRIGKNVDEDRKLSVCGVQRTMLVLKEYQNILNERYPEVSERVHVTATSAVRDASNRDLFMQAVTEKTGWRVRLLSGDEEAKLTFKGAMTMLDTDHNVLNVILDIGGGSTEVAIGTGKKLQKAFSMDMGCVRFTERYLKSHPPKRIEKKNAVEAIDAMLVEANWPEATGALIGVAGTVTALAGVVLGLNKYDAERLNGFDLPIKALQDLTDRFSLMRFQQIEEQNPVFLKGRGEVILAGLLILLRVMQQTDQDKIRVSTGGIQHGLLAEMYVE